MHIDYIICLIKLLLISKLFDIPNNIILKSSQNLYALFDCTRMQLIPVLNGRR